jgi:Lon protease-like protein
MKDTNLKLPIFPLPVFLLPDGITRLRIFEARYLKMVKIATRGQGFVIWLNPKDAKKTMHEWGSWVEVVNFNQGKDGVLEIDVKCKTLVDIHSIEKDVDNLHFGTVCETSHWSQDIDDNPVYELGDSLEEVLVNDSMLNELYPQRYAQNTNWVVARWLEILPVNLAVKSAFVNVYDYDEAKHFVQSIIG